jgi:hypothetical protein
MQNCKTTDKIFLYAMPLALVGMHISVLKINLCTDIFVSLTEGMQYY